jgi:hypothetical protein
MYVVATERTIFAFGLTRETAIADLVRRGVHYDGEGLDLHPCAPELYRQLEAKGHHEPLAIPFRIDSNGIAILVNKNSPLR